MGLIGLNVIEAWQQGTSNEHALVIGLFIFGCFMAAKHLRADR